MNTQLFQSQEPQSSPNVNHKSGSENSEYGQGSGNLALSLGNIDILVYRILRVWVVRPRTGGECFLH